MSNLRAPRQNGPYKNKHTEQHKHVEHQDATDIQNYFLVFFGFFYIVSIRRMFPHAYRRHDYELRALQCGSQTIHGTLANICQYQ